MFRNPGEDFIQKLLPSEALKLSPMKPMNDITGLPPGKTTHLQFKTCVTDAGKVFYRK